MYLRGIPILDQYLESPLEEPYPPNEEVTTTSSEIKVHLDDAKFLATSSDPKVHFYDLIKRIERLNLDENSTPSQSVEQPRLLRTKYQYSIEKPQKKYSTP
jgi:hypothetical protein